MEDGEVWERVELNWEAPQGGSVAELKVVRSRFQVLLSLLA